MPPINPEVLGIHPQSQGIKLNEWFAQFTQCLAPWVAHVLVGVPAIVNLTDKPIPWHRHIPLYNPLSIYWRYLIICDRRLRCRDWNSGRMATTCTMFWDGSRWSSTELETDQHLPRLVRPPPYSRTPIFSVPMLGTLVVVLQGSQALYEVFQVGTSGFVLTQGVAGVFLPIAISSLFRLAPSFWITNDFAFRDGRGGSDWGGSGAPTLAVELTSLPTRATDTSTSNGIQPTAENMANHNPPPFERQTHPKAIALRAVVVAMNMAIFVGQILHIPQGFTLGYWQSASGVGLHFLYHSLMGAIILLFPYYLYRKRADDAAIACMNARWYTIWTIVWYLGAATVITINAVEMRRTFCGAYTTYLPSAGLDTQLCKFYT